MSNGVEFEEDQFNSRRPNVSSPGSFRGAPSGYAPAPFTGFNSGSNEPAMVRWLMRHGFVKSPRGAQGLLIIIVIINILITFVVIKFFL